MSKITKVRWKWDEIHNPSKFRLGETVQPYIDGGILTLDEERIKNHSDDSKWYLCKEDIPRAILEQNDTISAIVYTSRLGKIPVFSEDLWDKDWPTIEPEIDKILDRVELGYKGDSLYAVFRDYYVAIVGIFRRK